MYFRQLMQSINYSATYRYWLAETGWLKQIFIGHLAANFKPIKCRLNDISWLAAGWLDVPALNIFFFSHFWPISKEVLSNIFEKFNIFSNSWIIRKKTALYSPVVAVFAFTFPRAFIWHPYFSMRIFADFWWENWGFLKIWIWQHWLYYLKNGNSLEAPSSPPGLHRNIPLLSFL